MCEECATIRARASALEADNRRLRLVLERARRVIKRQRGQLDTVQSEAWYWICEGGKAIGAGGMSKTSWAMWQGRIEVAYKIYSIVWVNWANEVLAEITGG